MKRLIFAFTVAIGLLLISYTANAMTKFPATDFFSGPQLALAQAIERGDLAKVRQLAPATDLNTPGRKNMTLLFFAFQDALERDPKQLEIMGELIKAGADPFQKVPNFGSVLGVTLNSPTADFLRILLDAGVGPNTIIDGESPILLEVTSPRTFDSLKLLIACGADVNMRDSLRNTALYEALTSRALDQIDYLLDHAANPNTYNINGLSFPYAISTRINQNASAPESITYQKLTEIRDRIIKMGVKWPPDTPEQIRARWGANAPRRLDDSQLPL
ncbi:ankyrin repeat domain-containing protein [Trinickia mobilis]|uniref:ankyrin repeat domain-containing protein n=1 Tax=Trinickia mobilis TaxID=2816356 RepID=UPI001A8DCD95|nr:ankyrin repeat domain-containing protein [Trinickia mobilis]